MTTECRYCSGLDCQPDYHEAAVNIHAYLRSLVNRNWAKDMAKAKAEAKKLHKAHHQKPDYRVTSSPRRNPNGTIETLLAVEHGTRQQQATIEQIKQSSKRGGMATKRATCPTCTQPIREPRKRPSRAAYMRQYRKDHPEAK